MFFMADNITDLCYFTDRSVASRIRVWELGCWGSVDWIVNPVILSNLRALKLDLISEGEVYCGDGLPQFGSATHSKPYRGQTWSTIGLS